MVQTSAKTKTPLRILYMHGLESGPNGSKAIYLRKHFRHVRSVDMDVSVWNLSKQNGIARNALLNLWSWRPLSRGVERSLEGCMQVQRQEILDFRPDVVVGSSWGGAIALLCVAAGHWKGPTVLLAPALKQSLSYCSSNHLSYREILLPGLKQHAGNTLILHGTDDKTVPFADSEELAKDLLSDDTNNNSKIALVSIDGGDHRLNQYILETSFLADRIRETHEGLI